MKGPGKAAFRSARKRSHEAHRGSSDGRIEIGGMVYEAVLSVGSEEWEGTDKGPRLVQRFRARVLKTLLVSPPKYGAEVVIGSKGFKVSEVAGELPRDVAWDIRGKRLVGRDRKE